MHNTTPMSELNYTIRFAIREDMNELILMCHEHALYEQSLYAHEGKSEKLFQHLFSVTPALYCIIVEDHAGIIGYASYMKEFSTWEADYYIHMDCLYLREHARNHGIGLVMIKKIALHAAEINVGFMQWQTPALNTRAIEFYHRLGAHSKKKLRMYLDIKTFLNKNNLN